MEELSGWFAGRIPAEWFQGGPDRHRGPRGDLRRGALAEPELPADAGEEARRRRSPPDLGVPRGHPRQADAHRRRGPETLRPQGQLGSVLRRRHGGIHDPLRAGDDTPADGGAPGARHPDRGRRSAEPEPRSGLVRPIGGRAPGRVAEGPPGRAQEGPGGATEGPTTRISDADRRSSSRAGSRRSKYGRKGTWASPSTDFVRTTDARYPSVQPLGSSRPRRRRRPIVVTRGRTGSGPAPLSGHVSRSDVAHPDLNLGDLGPDECGRRSRSTMSPGPTTGCATSRPDREGNWRFRPDAFESRARWARGLARAFAPEGEPDPVDRVHGLDPSQSIGSIRRDRGTARLGGPPRVRRSLSTPRASSPRAALHRSLVPRARDAADRRRARPPVDERRLSLRDPEVVRGGPARDAARPPLQQQGGRVPRT